MLISPCRKCGNDARLFADDLGHWVACTNCHHTGTVCDDLSVTDAVSRAIVAWNADSESANAGPQAHPAVAVLNRFFESDPDAMYALVMNRVPCNIDLANDPSGPVTLNPVSGNPRVGMMGVLNAILEEMRLPLVAYRYRTEPDEHGTCHIDGFQVYCP